MTNNLIEQNEIRPGAADAWEKLPEHLKTLGDELLEFVETKFELLKDEVKTEAAGYARDALLLGAGGVLAAMGLTLLHVPRARKIGGLYLTLGAGAALVLGNRLARRNPVPDRSVAELRKDAEWLQNQVRELRS